MAFLDQYFAGFAVAYGPIIAEMLRELFNKPPKRYGKYGHGVLAAYFVQAPADTDYTEEAVTIILHQTKQVMMDELSSYIVNLRFDGSYPYIYPGQEVVLVYLPVTPDVTDPQIRTNAVPLQAIRHFD